MRSSDDRRLAPPPVTRFDPNDPALIEDPYPAYAALRAVPPVHLPEHDMWVVSRYEDVQQVLRDAVRFSSRLGMGTAVGGTRGTGVDYRVGTPGVRVLIATDPPEHMVFRRAVAQAFAPATVRRRLQPRIETIVEQLLTDLLDRAEDGRADFFADIAEPLPVLVLAEILGVPNELHDEFRVWSRLVTSDLDQSSDRGRVGRGLHMLRYFRSEISARRDRSGEDLLDVLSRPSEANLSDQEILAFCIFLLVAGIETTTNLLTNLLAALLDFPEEFAAIRATHDLVPAAVEEGLRYDTPVQALWRATTVPVEVGGTQLPANARLLVLFASANRDERRFADPDLFRAARIDNDHMGFGFGPHYCLGAALARAETATVLRRLLERTASIEPSGEWMRAPSILLRGYRRQPVAVRPV